MVVGKFLAAIGGMGTFTSVFFSLPMALDLLGMYGAFTCSRVMTRFRIEGSAAAARDRLPANLSRRTRRPLTPQAHHRFFSSPSSSRCTTLSTAHSGYCAKTRYSRH